MTPRELSGRSKKPADAARSLRKLCITADDYGLCPSVNAGIEQLAVAGAIDAVSVMAHDSACIDGVERLAQAGVSIGLHVVWTRELAASDELAKSGLLDAAGRLPASYAHLIARLTLKPTLAALCAQEALRQASRLRRCGIQPEFLNAHEHAHLLPWLWPFVADVAETLDVHAVRVPLGRPLELSADGLLAGVARIAWKMRPLRGACIMSPIGGVGRAGQVTPQRVDRMLERVAVVDDDAVLAELPVHPDAARPAGELKWLLSGALQELLERRGICRARPSRGSKGGVEMG